MEAAAAYDSGVLVIAKRGGEVIFSDGNIVKIKTSNGEVDEYPLQKFKRTNQEPVLIRSL
jgi:DNA-directed RNA polymerase subunit beta